jgi:hypothetical protein
MSNKGMVSKPHMAHKKRSDNQKGYAVRMINRARYFKFKCRGEQPINRRLSIKTNDWF